MYSMFPTQFELARSSEIHFNFGVHMGVTCTYSEISVSGMVHIKEPLLLIEKSNPCGGSGFPLLLFEWSFTICLTPYNRK